MRRPFTTIVFIFLLYTWGWTQDSGLVPVTFRLELPQAAQSVGLAGSFNNWQHSLHPMRSVDGGKTWKVTVHLAPGAYLYKFVVNGTDWRTDPKAVQNLEDESGYVNSLIWVERAGVNPPARRGDGIVTLSALYHNPKDALYLHTDKRNAVLTVRVRRDDVQEVKALVHSGGRTVTKSMPEVARDALYAYHRAAVPGRHGRIAFVVRDGKRQIWLSPEGATYRKPTKWFPLTLSSFIEPQVPSWVQDAVFYQIMPDRFFNADPANDHDPRKPLDETGRIDGDGYFGGDIWGIVQRVEYLRALGITTLYLTPIFTSGTHHKYDTDDYTRVDPHFGGDDSLITLAHKLKQHRIRLVLDGVFNHVGVHFFAFRDLLQKQEASAYRSWFTVHRFPIQIQDPPNYSAWWNIPYVPKVNHENPQVRRYFLNVVRHWMTRVPIGGWRLDVANEVADAFWREFRKEVKRLRPDAVLIGEIWGLAGHWLRGDMFDSVMNYPWRAAVLSWIAFRRSSPSQLDERLRMLSIAYPRDVTYVLYNMLSSHDTPRLRTLCGGDWRKVRLAFLLQMTLPGAPAIYYGEEVGMEGGSIPDNRRPMDWNPSVEGKALRGFVNALIRIRQQQVALRRGEWTTLLTDDAQNVYAYLRHHGTQQVLVVVNNGEKEATVRLNVPGKALIYRLLLRSDDAPPSTREFTISRGRQLDLTLPAMSGWILVPAER